MKSLRIAPCMRHAVFAVSILFAAVPTSAQTFSSDSGAWTATLSSIYSLGAMMRTSGRDCRLIAVDNGGCNDGYLNFDDGNLNYRRGQWVAVSIRGNNDLSVRGPDGWSGLARVAYSADLAGDRVKSLTLDPEAAKAVRTDFRVLDFYVSKSFDIGDQPARLRLGNQVVSWGEGLFLPGGINATNAIDLRATHRPGVQVKEITIPAPMLSFSTSLPRSFSAEAYYQFRWNGIRLDPQGSFFSSFDYAGKGYQNLYFPSAALAGFGLCCGGDRHTGLPFQAVNDWLATGADPAFTPGIPVLAPRKGDHSGQFGLALRHLDSDSGNEVALYYMRYNDKLPSQQYFFSAASNQLIAAGQPDTAQLVYLKKRELYGASYNFRVGDWSMGTELSYRPRDAVPVDPTLSPSYSAPNCDLSGVFGVAGDTTCTLAWDRKKWQFALTAINLMSPSGSMGWLLNGLGASEGNVLAELVVAHYPNLVLGQGIPYAFQADLREPTKTSVGAAVSVSVAYPNAFGTAATIAPDLYWQQGLKGYSANAFPGFYKGVGLVGLGATIDFKRSNSMKLRLDYAYNFGGKQTGANPYLDRDYLSLALSVAY